MARRLSAPPGRVASSDVAWQPSSRRSEIADLVNSKSSSPKRRRHRSLPLPTQESSHRQFLRLPSLASSPGGTHHESHFSPHRCKSTNRLPQVIYDDTETSVTNSTFSDSIFANEQTQQLLLHASRRQSAAKTALESTNQISCIFNIMLEDSQQALVMALQSREEAENAAIRAEMAVQKVKEAGILVKKDEERAALELDEANAQAEEAREFLRRVRSISNDKKTGHHISSFKSNSPKTAAKISKMTGECDDENATKKYTNVSPTKKGSVTSMHANENRRRSGESAYGRLCTESHCRIKSDNNNANKQDDALLDPVHKFHGHEAPITQIAAIDQVHFISSSWDKTLRLWNANTGECIMIFHGHKDWVQAICQLDNEHFVSGSDDRTLKLWNVNKQESLRTFRGHGSFVKTIASMNGGRFLSGSRDKKIMLWQASSEQCLRTFEGHTDVVSAIVTLDSNLFLSGSHDKSIRCWNVNSGECVRFITGLKGRIKTLAVVSDNTRAVEHLVVSGDDKSIRLWDVFKGACLHEFECNVSVFSLTSICEGFFLSCGGNKIQLYHIASGKCVKSYETPRISLAVARLDDDRFVTGSDQVLQMWKF